MKASLLLGSALACLASGNAYAQTVSPDGVPQSQPTPSTPAPAPQPADNQSNQSSGVEDIIVTATRRAENLQNVPITVSAYSSDDLARASVKSVADLGTVEAGFTSPGIIAAQAPHIRGVGNQVTQPGLENSVALYVDGIYIGATTPALLTLNNIDQVEVLKGPQGTLFGRNTTAGLVQITTRKPSQELSFEGEVGYANYDTLSGSGYLNVPVSSSVATNFSVQVSHQGRGWGKNLFDGSDIYRQDLSLSLRNRWVVSLGSGTTINLDADYERMVNQGLFALRPYVGTTNSFGYTTTVKGWDINQDVTPSGRLNAWGLAGRVSQDLGFATLSNTLAYRKIIYPQFNGDTDVSPIPFAYFDRLYRNQQWTEELQLASTSKGKLQWTVGFFFYDATDSTTLPVHFLTPIVPFQQMTSSSRIRTTSYATYAEATYEILPSTFLTGGFRYSHDNHGITGDTTYLVAGTTIPGAAFGSPPANGSYSKDAQAYRVALRHSFSDQAMIYVSFNQGTKPGSYNPTYLYNDPYRDEKLTAYEAGTKLKLFDNIMRLNLSGFYYSYKDIQVNGFSASTAFIYNGGSAELYGLDATAELKLSNRLTVNGALEVLHSEFTSFPDAIFYEPLPTGGSTIVNRSAKGLSLPLAPKFTSSLSANYSIPASYGTWDLGANYAHNSGFWGDPGHTARQQPYNLVGASLKLTDRSGRYSVRIWGANLTNAQVTNLITSTTIANSYMLGPPRTYGFTLGAKFR